MEEIMDIVDENDNVIGQEKRSFIRKKNLLHRGCAVMVFNSKGEVLVHKRSKDKDLYPSCWDFVLGGGVDSGETYEEATLREAFEEAGVKDVELKFLFKFKYDSNDDRCFAKFYTCVYDGPITFSEREIEEGRFVTIKELDNIIKTLPISPDSNMQYELFNNLKDIKPQDPDKVFVLKNN
jgi:isopentenyldiphosphate isomerase